ncbi:hypothetical protein LTR85_008687 [Meristemomyces frigidus]|nr:hypothetical protein LTR85_008687 [Meristemomyces frigidus]
MGTYYFSGTIHICCYSRYPSDMPHPITRVNRQVRQECTSLLLSATALQFDVFSLTDDGIYSNCIAWAHAISDDALRAVNVFRFTDLPEEELVDCNDGFFYDISIDMRDTMPVSKCSCDCYCQAALGLRVKTRQMRRLLSRTGLVDGKSVMTRRLLLDCLEIAHGELKYLNMRHSRLRFVDARSLGNVARTIMASTTDQAQGTGFLDLPPELRNQIYVLHKGDTKTPENLWIYERKEASDFPFAITRVSRQIRAEASSMFYHKMDIELDLIDQAGLENSKEWLELMHSDGLAAIASFTLSASRRGCECASPCTIRVSMEAGKSSVMVRKRGAKCWVKNGASAKVRVRVAEIVQGVERMTKELLLEALEALKAVGAVTFEEQQIAGKEEWV